MATTNLGIPGLPSLTSQASDTISNLLSGTPSPSTTQQAAATFGVQNGLGTGSGIVNNYGYNLYNQKGQASQQQGLTDLLNMIGSYAGNVEPSAGQNLQNTQFNQSLNQSGNEFNATNSIQQFNAMLSALGLGLNGG